jgi:hypothetical protein
MTTFPALYAALEPADDHGRRGFTVRCTATRATLGFVWWEVLTGTTVAWHFRSGDTSGERTTQRNAVQALRDLANGHPFAMPVAATLPTPTRRATAPRAPSPAPAPAPAPTRRVLWDDALPAFDVRAAVAAGFGKAAK